MPTYEVLLHATGFRLPMDGGSPATGFYMVDRVLARTAEEASKIALELMDSDPKIADVFKSGHAADLDPRTEVEKVDAISWWRAILPWRKLGLAFYSDDAEEDASGPPG